LVPCDLCDHSQISHVVINDVRSDILLTTIHVFTDWPISDHMIGTSHISPVQQSVFPCVRSTQWALRAQAGKFINGHPPLHCSRSAVYIHGPDGKWLKYN
ncbi:unnamed protein product, partial [Staurois parvus]